MGINYFDKIFYINLDHRKDRKEKLLKQLKKLDVKQEKIIRIPAILDLLNGQRGCALSHIKALDLAIEKNLKNILILEDDCEFVQPKFSINSLIKYFFQNIQKWDVFFLGSDIAQFEKTKYEKINRILKSYLAHAYAVNRHYMETLKKCFEESYFLLKKEVFFNQKFDFAIDKHWNYLQKKDKWYMLNSLIAKQSMSYSDIEKIEKERLKFNI